MYTRFPPIKGAFRRHQERKLQRRAQGGAGNRQEEGEREKRGGPQCFSFALLVLSLPLTRQSQTSWLGLDFFPALYKSPRVKNVAPLELCLSAQSFLSVRVPLRASLLCQGQRLRHGLRQCTHGKWNAAEGQAWRVSPGGE